MNKDSGIMVSIVCITYNHEKYISQAIEGFLNQKTTFKTEIIIHDDCSTDTTKEIINFYEKKYPEKIKVYFEKENQYSLRKYQFLKEVYDMANGKYIAFCEGDDYWVDNNKLQKEIDYLEKHDDCRMVYTDFDILYQKTGRVERTLFKKEPERFKHKYTLDSWILDPGYVAPMTWVFEKKLMENYQFLNTLDETFVMFAYFLYSTNVKCLINENTAVYRILEESASHSSSLEKVYTRAKNMFEIHIHLANLYDFEEPLKFEIESRYFNRTYKLLSVLGKKEELEKAKKYCTKCQQKVLFSIVKIPIIRYILQSIYRKFR